MRKATLFIGMSLDGYIAGKDGNVGWMQGQNPNEDDMASYSEFIKGIDTVVMGWNTYFQIVTSLSPEEWPYTGLNTVVLTHRKLASKENIRFVNQDVCAILKELKQQPGKGIWICGGARLIQPLIQERLIDRYHISILPTIFGDGLRLFQNTGGEIKLKLLRSISYNGITDVVYEYREK